MNMCIRLAACLLGVLISTTSFAQFLEVDHFPTPAAGAFSVVGAAQADGCLVLWDGLNIHRQSSPGGSSFYEIATGYDGTGGPGFMSVAPDGATMALGAGFGDGVTASLYLFDTSNPQSGGSPISVPSHYWGVFLTNDLLLLDIGAPTFGESLLAIVDLTAKSTAPSVTPVVTGIPKGSEKTTVVDKPGGVSAAIGINGDRTTIFVTEPHDFDAQDTEIRSFAVADVLNAFSTSTPLNFETDGTLIGTPGAYLGGGVVGVRPNGVFVIPGAGGVQLYNPNTDMVEALLDPAFAGPFSFYFAIYNEVTDEILPILTQFGSPPVTFATENAVASLPAVSGFGLALAASAIATGAFTRRKRR